MLKGTRVNILAYVIVKVGENEMFRIDKGLGSRVCHIPLSIQ